jgi:mRNA interferase RelE/StbE
VKVDVAEEAIGLSSEISEHNCGDLAGVYVYKFKIQNQRMLLVYEYDPHTRMLLLFVSHENFIWI